MKLPLALKKINEAVMKWDGAVFTQAKKLSNSVVWFLSPQYLGHMSSVNLLLMDRINDTIFDPEEAYIIPIWFAIKCIWNWVFNLWMHELVHIHQLSYPYPSFKPKCQIPSFLSQAKKMTTLCILTFELVTCHCRAQVQVRWRSGEGQEGQKLAWAILYFWFSPFTHQKIFSLLLRV